MAAPVLAATTTGTFASDPTSVVVTSPSSVAVGDILVVTVKSDFTDSVVTAPSGAGFTTLYDRSYTGIREAAFIKKATAAGAQNYTFGIAQGSGTNKGDWAVMRVTGASETVFSSGYTGTEERFGDGIFDMAGTPTAVTSDALYIAIINSGLSTAFTVSSPGFTQAWGSGSDQRGLTKSFASGATVSPITITTNETGSRFLGNGIVLVPPPAAQTVSPTGIGSAEVFGTPNVVHVVSPTGIATAEALGSPTLTTGAVTVSPDSIGSAETFGSPLVQNDGVTQNIIAVSIVSAETFGAPTVSRGTITLSPPGIATAVTFGTAIVALEEPNVGLIARPLAPGYFRIKLTSLHYGASTDPAAAERPSKTLARLEDFSDAQVTIPINDARDATVTISMHAEAAAAVAPYKTLLHIVYATPTDAHLVFWGIVTQPEWDPEAETVTIPAVDMSLRLQHRQIRWGTRILNASDDPTEPNPFNNTSSKRSTGNIPIDYVGLRWLRDVGRNTESMNNRGVPPLGITDGANTASLLPSDTDFTIEGRRGDTVWDVIQEFVGYQIAPDFELEPRDKTFGVYARLNTYDRQGSADPTRILFHDGFGLDNALITYRPGGKVITHNHVLSTGDETRVTLADLASSAEIGPYIQWDSTDYPARATGALQDHAQQTIDAYGTPPDYFSVTPNLDCGLCYLDDFAIGDALSAAVRRGQLQRQFTGDITRVVLAQADAAGNVRTEIEVAVTVGRTTADEGDV